MNKLIETLFSLVGSKKAVAMLAGLVITICSKYGIFIPEESLIEILSVIVAYIVGQGIADAGKEAALIGSKSSASIVEPKK
jgi:hypothetical protein